MNYLAAGKSFPYGYYLVAVAYAAQNNGTVIDTANGSIKWSPSPPVSAKRKALSARAAYLQALAARNARSI